MNTNWSEFLVREGATLDGAQLRFDPPEAEARQAASGTVAVPLVHLGLIRAAGEDSAPFLHNLFSNDVNKLGADCAQWNSFNSPKGRMLASLLLWRESGGHLLACAADVHAMLLKKLSMYVLRSKVKLSDGGADTVLVGVSGADAEAVLARAGLPCAARDLGTAHADGISAIRLDATRHLLALPAADAPRHYGALLAAGAARAGTDAWHLAMIRAGIPLVTAATQEEFVPQMLNYELIGGISFTKGCYPGQEIVARTRYLGKLKKRMYRLHLDGTAPPLPGSDLFAPEFGDQSAGKVVNAAPAAQGGFELLAVLQTSAAAAGEIHCTTPEGPRLTLLDLPYPLG